MSYSRRQKLELPPDGLKLNEYILPGLNLKVKIDNRFHFLGDKDIFQLELSLNGDNCGSEIYKDIYETLENIMVRKPKLESTKEKNEKDKEKNKKDSADYTKLESIEEKNEKDKEKNEKDSADYTKLESIKEKNTADYKRLKLGIDDNVVIIRGAELVQKALGLIIEKMQKEIFKLEPEDENWYLAKLRCFKDIIKKIEAYKKIKEENTKIIYVAKEIPAANATNATNAANAVNEAIKNYEEIIKKEKEIDKKQKEKKKLTAKENIKIFIKGICCPKQSDKECDVIITNFMSDHESPLFNDSVLWEDISLWDDIKSKLHDGLEQELVKKHDGLKNILKEYNEYEAKIKYIKDVGINEYCDFLNLISDEFTFRENIKKECKLSCRLQDKRNSGFDLLCRSINNIDENKKFVKDMNIVNNMEAHEKEVRPILKKLTLEDKIKKLNIESKKLDILINILNGELNKKLSKTSSEKRKEEGSTSLKEAQQEKPDIKEKLAQRKRDKIQEKLTIAQRKKDDNQLKKAKKEKDKIQEQLKIAQQRLDEIQKQLQDSPRQEKIRVTTLEQLIIAQQKRDVIQELEEEILRLKGCYRNKEIIELKIKAYLEFITIIKNSDINLSINEILIYDIFKNKPLINLNNKSILQVLTDKRIGFFSTSTSGIKLEELLKLPDPKEIFSSPSAKKPKFSIRQQNIH